MKIRTVTTGIHLSSGKDISAIERAAAFNRTAASFFQSEGYDVQTIRVATNSWEEYINTDSEDEAVKTIVEIERVAKKCELSFFNIGRTMKSESIKMLPAINKATSIISCSAHLGSFNTGILFENAREAAQTMKRIGNETENGYGNFRFCASANCSGGIPYFPTGFHEGKESIFGLGFECGDIAFNAFSETKDLQAAKRLFHDRFLSEAKKVEKLAEVLSKKEGIRYNGIDVSLNPGLLTEESIAFAFENIGLGTFGKPGTLTVAGMITDVLKNLEVKRCGYSGLMLPVCEDAGLAERANEGAYNISNLLLYSAVCGCGLDVVPIPGNTNIESIEAILLDTATLAIKLNKPLSVRMLLVPGKKVGECTTFNSPYMVESNLMDV